MNSNDHIIVKYRGKTVGTLSMSGSAATFEYCREWLSDGFSLSPLELPLQSGLFIADSQLFAGNFAIFEDSIPDGYGRYLLHKILRGQGVNYLDLNPLQRLSIVGSQGMGALTYEPETFGSEQKSIPTLDELQRMALDVLSERKQGDEDVLYFNSGNSGGCRPKCLYSDSEGHWLVKFRHTYDPAEMGEMEYRYAVAARGCGIAVPDFKLIEGKYFASKRFDIDVDGQRLHVATAAALMKESINPPKADYINLLHLTGYLTQDPQQVEEMFRRMVFNVVASNLDDHAKNFSFIYDGRWRLAPAYDLTYSPVGYNGEHATSVNYNGRPTVSDMVEAAKSVRIAASRARDLIAYISNVCTALH